MRKSPLISLVISAVAVLLALAGCNSGTPEPVRVGDRAPDFTLPSANGGQVSLAELTAKTNVLLYFNMAYG